MCGGGLHLGPDATGRNVIHKRASLKRPHAAPKGTQPLPFIFLWYGLSTTFVADLSRARNGSRLNFLVANQASRSTDANTTQTRITALNCYFNVPLLLTTRDLPGKHSLHDPASFCCSIRFGATADSSLFGQQTLKGQTKIFSENDGEVLIHFYSIPF